VTHLWAIILGVVQGLAEFLPISSTAHLKLVPWLFGVSDPMLSSSAFDIALHAGSLVAIIAALWRDWLDLVVSAFGREPSSDTGQHHDVFKDPRFARKFFGFLVLTSVPGALFGVLLDKKLEFLSTPDITGQARTGIDATTFHYAPLLLGLCMMGFGVVLWASDRFVARKEPLETMRWWQALLVGAAQALALIPGVSRSGSTMTAGRLLGFDRESVARYSFMAAAPIIAGAAVFGLKDVPMGQLLSVDWLLGFAAAAVTSVFVMRWVLSYVKNHSFAIFMWYRLAFGALVIAVFFMRG